MDLAFVIRHRLKELGLDQKGLSVAARVTESYISQLLAGKKPPPDPNRTDVYEKMEAFLELPSSELSKMAALQRREYRKRRIVEPPQPLFRHFRDLTLRKCRQDMSQQVRAIFEKEPFGELERLVTQKLLDVAKGVAREELENEQWMHLAARLSRQTYEQMRVTVLEFLDTDIFHISLDNCVSFMEPLVDSWSIDLATFSMEIVLNRRLALAHLKRFAFVERHPEPPIPMESALGEFLADPLLSGNVTAEEVEFLKQLRFKDKRPNAMYYYRELQNLRDPMNFHPYKASKEGD